jgi:hypothetical protein
VAAAGSRRATSPCSRTLPSRRAALAGIVQALLVTRHMLFVGFSLRDDTD